MIAHEFPETPSMHATIGLPSSIIGGYGNGKGRARMPVSYVECRLCGFEPEEQVVLPRCRCPKCHSHTWWRLVRPGTFVEHDVETPITAH